MIEGPSTHAGFDWRNIPFAMALAAAVGGCAAPVGVSRHRPPMIDRPEATRSTGEAIARGAVARLGRSLSSEFGDRLPDDCTGLVRAAYSDVGIDLLPDGGRPGENGVTAIYRFAAHHGRVHEGPPRPGDLVFFRETYDRNRDGRENDGLTHVGIVERFDAAGTVVLIHRVDSGIVRHRMTLARRALRSDPATGQVLNDYLRAGRPSRLTGELFAGFGTLITR
jgi:hypothetical protein